MVHPTDSDVITGFIIYKRSHPEFPLTKDAHPPLCPNFNDFSDGGYGDIINILKYQCSRISYRDGPDDEEYLNSLWNKICDDYEKYEAKGIRHFLKYYKIVVDRQKESLKHPFSEYSLLRMEKMTPERREEYKKHVLSSLEKEFETERDYFIKYASEARINLDNY